jgi:replicative DNA helicase
MDFTPKSLPTNLEAEQAVLAAIFMDNRVIEKLPFLLPEHFSHPAHQEIYRRALRWYEINYPFDLICVKDYFEQQGLLESVGGVEYLTKLAGAGTTVVNIEHYGRIIFDNARRRDLIKVSREIMDDAYTENPENPVNAQIETAEQKLFNLSYTGQSEHNFVSLADALHNALEEAEHAYKAEGKLSGLTTGLDDLDKSIGGLHHSDLIIIAGRPGMGKTTVAMNIAFNAANAVYTKRANKAYKGAVVFFSLEMSNDQLAARVLASQAKIPSTHMRDGNLTDEEFMKMTQYSAALTQIPLVIDDTADMSVPLMKTRLRRIANKFGGIALIVIDYLQLMTLPGGKHSENRVQELSEITRGLKILAKEMDVPVIALSQLSRSVEQRTDKHPMLSDLRESGSIEQDADIVMFTYRQDYYPQQEGSKKGEKHQQQKRQDNIQNEAELIIAKNRHGKQETVKLAYFAEYSLFDNLIQMAPQPTDFEIPNGNGDTSTPDVSDAPDDII